MVRVVAQEEGLTAKFRSKLAEDGFATEALGLVQADADLDDNPLAPKISNEEAMANEGQKRAVQFRVGMGDAEDLSGGLQGAAAAEAARRRAKNEEKEAKQRFADAQLQALLDQIAAIDAQIEAIDEQIKLIEAKIDTLNETMAALRDGSMSVEEAMNDSDVSDAVKDWERRTGKKFDPNDPETADILVAIIAAQVDEYGNDIAALKRERNELEQLRNDIQADVDKLVELKTSGASPEVVEAEAKRIASDYDGGRALGMDGRLKVDEVEGLGRDGQDHQSDVAVNSANIASDNSDVMAGLFGGDAGSDSMFAATDEVEPPSEKLAASTQDARQEFKSAAAVPSDELQKESGIDFVPDQNQMG